MSLFQRISYNDRNMSHKLILSSDYLVKRQWRIFNENNECVYYVVRPILTRNQTIIIKRIKDKKTIATIEKKNWTYTIHFKGRPFDIIKIDYGNYVSSRIDLKLIIEMFSERFELNGKTVAKVVDGRTIIYQKERHGLYLLFVYLCRALTKIIEYDQAMSEL